MTTSFLSSPSLHPCSKNNKNPLLCQYKRRIKTSPLAFNMSSKFTRLSPWLSTVYRYSMCRRHWLIHFFPIYAKHLITHV